MGKVIERIQRSRVLRVLAHRGTMYLGKTFPETFPMVFVLGFPKSGTTWACQLVADYLRLPFPQFALLPHTFSSVVHGHDLSRSGYAPQAYVVRDGRDVAVSMFHFEMRKLSPDTPQTLRGPLVKIFPKQMPEPEESLQFFKPFLELFLEKPPASPVPWSHHVRTFLQERGPKQGLLVYEKLLSQGQEELSQCMATITGETPDEDYIRQSLEKFAFKRVAESNKGRAPMRKGIAGDWRQHFSEETAQMFHDSAGDLLIELGYEQDSSWTKSFADVNPTD